MKCEFVWFWFDFYSATFKVVVLFFRNFVLEVRIHKRELNFHFREEILNLKYSKRVFNVLVGWLYSLQPVFEMFWMLVCDLILEKDKTHPTVSSIIFRLWVASIFVTCVWVYYRWSKTCCTTRFAVKFQGECLGQFLNFDPI